MVGRIACAHWVASWGQLRFALVKPDVSGQKATMDSPTCFAIDFGTSNSLLAAARPGRTFPPATIDPGASDPTVLRSALYFRSFTEAEFGSRAITALVDNDFQGRLLRSIKRHLPSKSFTSTRIGSKQATLEDLIGRFLSEMRLRGCAHYGADVRKVVLGRPARFSSDPEADALAERRLRTAAEIAGFTHIEFCPEPVAAAADFADVLESPKLVLVADLGGGTSDFTVVRLGGGEFRPSDVLAIGGVAVAGDALDGGLVRSVVAPHFGSRARYQAAFGHNDLEMPRALTELLASPGDLTVMDRERVKRQLLEIQKGLIDPRDRPLVERFIALVEDGLGFTLYEAIEQAKRRLSSEPVTPITVTEPSLAFEDSATREGFISVSERAIDAIFDALRSTLDRAQVSALDIDILCLTGGTSQIPWVVERLASAVGNAQIRRLRSFHSVVTGLAVHAERLSRST